MTEIHYRSVLVEALMEHKHLDPRKYDSSSTLMSSTSESNGPSIVANAQDGLLTKGELGKFLKAVFEIDMRETKGIYNNLLRSELKHKSDTKAGLGTTAIFDAMLKKVVELNKPRLTAEDLKQVVASVFGISASS